MHSAQAHDPLHPSAGLRPLLDIPLIAILVGSTLWRAVLAYIFPLTTDEAYGLVVGRSFSLSFYDHPPVAFWLPAMAEKILGGGSELILRLPLLALGTLTVYGFYLLGSAISGKHVGRICAILAALTPYIGLAGVTAVPDSTLLLGLVFALYSLIRLASGEEEKVWLWFLGGASLALALGSKYQALFFPLGVLIWILSSSTHRPWLRKPIFWGSVLLALAGVLPLLIWNAQNSWVSFAFQTGRAEADLNLGGFLTLFIGQFAYFSPVLLGLVIWQIFYRENWTRAVHRLPLLTGLVIFGFFNGVFLFASSGLPHWPLAGAALLLPLVAAHWLKGYSARLGGFTLVTLGLSQVVVLIIGLHVSFGILTARLDPTPDWDRTMPLIRLSSTRETLADHHIDFDNHLVFTRNWQEAGHIGAVLGPHIPIRVLGTEANHFAFLPEPAPYKHISLLGLAKLTELGPFSEDLMALALEKGYDIDTIQTLPLPRGARAYQALILIELK